MTKMLVFYSQMEQLSVWLLVMLGVLSPLKELGPLFPLGRSKNQLPQRLAGY